MLERANDLAGKPATPDERSVVRKRCESPVVPSGCYLEACLHEPILRKLRCLLLSRHHTPVRIAGLGRVVGIA